MVTFLAVNNMNIKDYSIQYENTEIRYTQLFTTFILNMLKRAFLNLRKVPLYAIIDQEGINIFLPQHGYNP